MKFWMGLVFTPTAELKELALTAERAGFTGVTFSSHLVTHVERKPGEKYPYRGHGRGVFSQQTEWPDPFITMATLAAATTTLRFTTSIFVLPLRDPFVVAKQLSSLAVFSDNRVSLGVGAGWQESEFRILGQDFHTRGRRMDEMLEVMGELMSGEDVEHHGRFYDFDWLHMLPAPTKPVPIYVGGESDAALRRAARHDGWIGTKYTMEELETILGRLNEARREAGTLDRDFEIFIGSNRVTDIDTFRRWEDMGVTSVLASPWMDSAEPGSQFTLEEKCRCIEEFGARFIR